MANKRTNNKIVDLMFIISTNLWVKLNLSKAKIDTLNTWYPAAAINEATAGLKP